MASCKRSEVARIEKSFCLLLGALGDEIDELETMELEFERAALSHELLSVRLGPTVSVKIITSICIIHTNTQLTQRHLRSRGQTRKTNFNNFSNVTSRYGDREEEDPKQVKNNEKAR